MNYSMNTLYKTVGITKQAVDQYDKRQLVFDQKTGYLMIEAEQLRRDHPGCGVEKMYNTLKPDFIGRDRFIDTFMSLGYRLKRVNNQRRTTYAGSIYYPNLIQGAQLQGASEIWQSDITYIRVKEKFYYAVFIIDVYTKEIVGYSITDHMRASANTSALKMALKKHQAPKIHHSDRGSQYTSHQYTKLLRDNGTSISMGLIAQENAYAERINGTIKNEFIKYWDPQNYEQLKRSLNKAVAYYNNKRPHNNIKKNNPRKYSLLISSLKPYQRKTMTIFDYNN